MIEEMVVGEVEKETGVEEVERAEADTEIWHLLDSLHLNLC